MDSGRDLPKEGFPHSDICGSTIARISPQLFAACHVLHRLLAPRHPPNALVSLDIEPTPRPHAGPNRDPTAERAAPMRTTHSQLFRQFSTNSIFTCERTPADAHPLRDTTPDGGLGSTTPAPPARDPTEETWRQPESNRRPPACKAGALPAELCPRRGTPQHPARCKGHGPGRT